MLNRLKNFLLRPIANPGVESLYRACVAQARQPYFYAALGVPDTVEGRFDLLVLHVYVTIQRLRDHADETQQLFDILFADMDKSLREMGVSDISISKKMKPMLAAFYGRAKAYEEALAGDDALLSEAVNRNIFAGKGDAQNIAALVGYVRRVYTAIVAQSDDELLGGKIRFPLVDQNV